MAPRGRPRKPRNSRIDAAIDHMNNIGFPEELVRRKMKNLLEVYGGEWVFIEADNYAVLLEAILEEIENTKQEKDNVENPTEGDNEENSTAGENMVDNPPKDARVEDADLLPGVCSSSGGVEQSTSHPKIINTSTQPGDLGGRDCSMHVEEQGRKGSKDSEVSNNNEGFYVGEGHISNNAAYSPPPLVISPSPVEANPPRGRRKPCHGWISDGEDDDFLNLTPAAVVFSATPSATLDGKAKKKKTRWDVRPE